MTLSRTARYLVLILLLAAAAFVWVNYFQQNRAADGSDPLIEDAQSQTTPLQAGVQPDVGADTAEGSPEAIAPDQGEAATDGAGTDPAVTAVQPGGEAVDPAVEDPEIDPAVVVADPEGADVEPVAEAPQTDAVSEAAGEGAADTPIAVPEVPTVIAPTAQTVVERELEVAQFPFLVTEPPTTTAAAGGEEGGEVQRPQTQRASINPFSPVLVQRPVAPATPVAAAVSPPSTEPTVAVVAVDVPGAPSLPQVSREPVVETVVAPTPRPLAPPSPVAQNLPRQLPGGTLPVAPDILQTTRVVPQQIDPVIANDPPEPAGPDVPLPAPGEVAAAALIREPSDTLAADLEAVGTSSESSGSLPGLLGPAEIVVEAASDGAAGTTPIIPAGDVPLAAGTNRLTRYLRDNGVTFTGSVLGPVSVGVFTSTLYTSPVVVSLGQTLPDTEIVLTDLRGQQAEFTLDDTAQVLTLDLRR